jgi:alpha-mannosidase
VALLNDGKYGHSVVGGVIGMSLVRRPLSPDPFADEDEHHFSYALFPHEGTWVSGKVVQAAQAFNATMVVTTRATSATGGGFVSVSGVELGFGALKKAHDRDGLVLRVYEPHGARGLSTLSFQRPVKNPTRVNLLEEDIEGFVNFEGNEVTISPRPFELVSLLLEF